MVRNAVFGDLGGVLQAGFGVFVFTSVEDLEGGELFCKKAEKR